MRVSARTVAEVIGASGVVIGLLFVGMQIRQSAIATRAATVLELKQTWVELNLSLANDPGIAELLVHPYEEADPAERFRIQAFYRAVLYSLSNAHSQYLIGTLTDDEWLPHLRDAAELATNPVFQTVWEQWEHVYGDRFRIMMDSLMAASIGAEPPGG